jgi:hypothetical protein
MATDPSVYPRRPNDISPEWLTAALQAGGHLSPGTSITALARRPVGEGVGRDTNVRR